MIHHQYSYYDCILSLGINAITGLGLYRLARVNLDADILESIEQLESRAFTWVQLGQLKQEKYVDSLATLEAATNKGLIESKGGPRKMDEYLAAVKRALLAVITMMNRPLFVFQAICLQGFPHHLLVYVVIPNTWGSFNMRVRSLPLGARGISDIRQWILMCRFNVGEYEI